MHATLAIAERCTRTNPRAVQRIAQRAQRVADEHGAAAQVDSRTVVLRLDPDDVVVRDDDGTAAVADHELAPLGAVADSRSDSRPAIDANVRSRRRTRVRSRTIANRSSENGFSR